MDRVDVGGLSVAYERVGSGPALVLVHGYVADGPTTWRHQLDVLSDQFTVVAWDAPGAGGSTDPPEGFGIRGYADCLAGFIGELGLGPAHVGGLSFGGAVALSLSGRHPALTRTLTLAAAYAGWFGSLPTEAAEARLREALRLSELPAEQLVATLLPTMFGPTVSPTDVECFRDALAASHPSGLRAMARAAAEDQRDVLPRIAAPTLIVWGDGDERAPRPVAEALHAAIVGSRLVVLPGVGHVCNIEAADRFNLELRGFLREEDDAVR